jgi:hypothetical protein
MKEIILAKQSILGGTDSGRNWCLKALHPSDPLVEVTGIPDQDATPTTFMNYQSTFTVTSPTPDQTWKFDACLLPHPIQMMYVRKARSDDFASNVTNFLNPQVAGGTSFEKCRNFVTNFERWRLAYMSVTVYQDSPALANQGTIVVCQPPVKPIRGALAPNNIPYVGTIIPQLVLPRFEAYTTSDYPNYEKSQSMPNAYFARSEAGAYVPLKLTSTCQKWHSEQDMVIVGNQDLEAVVPPELKDLAYLMGGVGMPGYSTLADMPTTGPFPFPAIHSTGRVHTVNAAGKSPTAMVVGEATPAMCNDVWAHISARNLSPQTSFSFFVRAGFELQVNPSSTLSPQLRLSPQYDPAALQHYFAIAREMKDAYPADYNDLGKLWAVIKNVANTVMPILKQLPTLGPVFTAVEGPVRASVSALEKALVPSTKRDTPSAGAIEAAKKALPLARTAVVRTTGKKMKRRASRRGAFT